MTQANRRVRRRKVKQPWPPPEARLPPDEILEALGRGDQESYRQWREAARSGQVFVMTDVAGKPADSTDDTDGRGGRFF